MDFNLAVYPICVSSHERAAELNNSNYILLPSTMLLDIAMRENPLLFTIQELVNATTHHCGVLEFIDEPGICYIPFHIFEKLQLNYGSIVSVREHICVTGSKIHLKPEEMAFIQLDDPKAVLEESINKYYPVLSVDDVIHIMYEGREYKIKVTKTFPESSVKTLNCDIIVEFEEPDDMDIVRASNIAEDSAVAIATATAAAAANLTPIAAVAAASSVPLFSPGNHTYDTARFPGTGHRLGSIEN